jgi:hypothetical protein
MVSLYGRLFTYRERPQRSPLEDYLTEALADLLNRTPTSEMVEFVSKFFLPPLTAANETWQELVKTCSSEGLQWRTHTSIYVGKSIRYPDLTLYAGEERPLLIVENKVASGIGSHESSQLEEDDTDQEANTPFPQPTETIDQLATYGRWLSARCEDPWPGAIVFLTHLTPPPAGFGVGDRNAYGVEWQRVCKWHDVWRWLIQASQAATGNPAWRALAAELAEFLVEQNMNAESFTFYDMSAAEIFIKSTARFEQTFKQIREALKPQWPNSTFSNVTRGRIEYNGGGGILWDWMHLRRPHSPVDENLWYIAWGIRFPELSDRWKDASPALPKTNHAFVSLGSEGPPYVPVSSPQVRAQLTAWSVVPDDCIVAGDAVCKFSDNAETLGDQLVKWIVTKTEELKPILPQLVQLAGRQPPPS